MKSKQILMALLGAVVVLSIGAIAMMGNIDEMERAMVHITVGGTIIDQVDIHSSTLPQTIEITGKNDVHNTVVIEDGRVRVTKADCRDQICVGQGWISDGTLPIVCLPSQLIVEIVGGDGDALDTATG